MAQRPDHPPALDRPCGSGDWSGARRRCRGARDDRAAVYLGMYPRMLHTNPAAAEAPSRLAIPEEALESWPAERIFDLRWAATVVERALRNLAEECERSGRRRVFDVLSPSLAAEREDVSIAELARRLGVAEPAVKRLLHEMRKRYRALLREEVADTVEKSDSVDEEVRYLCAALALRTQ